MIRGKDRARRFLSRDLFSGQYLTGGVHMRWPVLAVVTVVALLLPVPTANVQAVVFPTLYDDFNSPSIDPNRWAGWGVQSVARAPQSGYEVALAQVLGRLRFALQSHGDISAVPGARVIKGNMFFDMVESQAASKTGVQVTVRVEDYEITGCAQTPPGDTAARLNAFLFRFGSNPNPSDPDDRTGVVQAVIQIRALRGDPPNTLRVDFFATRCDDSTCSTDTEIGSGSFSNEQRGVDVVLGIEWDAANKLIKFSKDAESDAFSYASFGTGENTANTRLLKALQLRQRLEACPARARGRMIASFENFRTKP